jgi:eukaryotic-like serine/threonine-protein kinase
MTDLSGQDFDRYHLVAPLGEGGMASVYKAYDTRLKRDVAVKIIRTDQFTPASLRQVLKRFEREAQLLAKLTHPNIVSIIDYGEHAGAPYLVMEYLPGGTLKDRSKGQPIPWQEAVRILLPVAEALDYAHSQNIIHRDVKPSNILLTGRGQPMLSDFGIARILVSEETQTLTGTGVGIGTPEYMAPEQWTGQAVPQSDVYSLGVVLYELVTGRKPYTADTPAAILLKQATEPLPRPKKFVPDLPERLEKAISKALTKKPEDRYQSMAEFSTMLENLLSGQARTKPPVIRREKRKAEKSPQFEQPIPLVKKPIEEQPTGDVQPIVDEKLGEPTPPETPPDRTFRRGRIKIRPALIIALVGFAAVVAFAIWGMPSPNAWLAPIPAATPNLTASLAATNTLTILPTDTSKPKYTQTATITYTPSPTLGIGSAWTSPKDGLAMMYVPEGNFVMGAADGSGKFDEYPQHTVYLDAFWMDKTDVTNAMFAKCVQAGACSQPYALSAGDRPSYYGNPQYDNFPVVYVEQDLASAYCEWAGESLPTEAQWEKAARGTDGRRYPWGNSEPDCTLANFFGCAGGTTDVNSHPAGASPYGILDMAGNVWQAVADWYDPGYYSVSPLKNPAGPSSGQYRILRGGAWNYYDNSLPSSIRLTNLSGDWSHQLIGFRCARGSSPGEVQTPKPTSPPAPTVASTPAPGTQSTSPVDGMAMVYVPAGEFGMGSKDPNPDVDKESKPFHNVTLDAFWIDQTEVTNAMYRLCVDAGKCEVPRFGGYSGSQFYGESKYDQYPINYVDWNMANAYCTWAGRRLPTEAEWEKAARGTGERIYPWGNEAPGCAIVNYYGCLGHTSTVGSYPAGASPYGLLDMAGNVAEWLSDWYSETYYSQSPVRNPQGPASGQDHVMRGGSWTSIDQYLPVSMRGSARPDWAQAYIGFRCARSAQ